MSEDGVLIVVTTIANGGASQTGGHRNVAIAERFFLSPRTVENHVSAILAKLDVQSRGQAVVKARQLGLLPPP